MPTNLTEIQHELKTQDNRITADPIFVVEQKARDWGVESGYTDNFEWVDMESGDYEEADPEDAAVLESKEEAGESTHPWEKVGYRDRWEFVTACLTEKGAKDFIMCQAHNLGDTRIFAYSGYHNDEWRALRKALLEGEF